VFVGFRLAKGGAQAYFGVRADMVTYGKTLGGGLPSGRAVRQAPRGCGAFATTRQPTSALHAAPSTAHPYVMGAMNAFLRRLDDADIAACTRVWTQPGTPAHATRTSA